MNHNNNDSTSNDNNNNNNNIDNSISSSSSSSTNHNSNNNNEHPTNDIIIDSESKPPSLLSIGSTTYSDNNNNNNNNGSKQQQQQPIIIRNRKVSWAGNDFHYNNNNNNDIIQNNIKTTTTTGSTFTSSNNNNNNNNRPGIITKRTITTGTMNNNYNNYYNNNNNNTTTKVIHVEDIVNYEQEAEIAILRAIEKHRRINTGTSTILSQVPISDTVVVHDFEPTTTTQPGCDGSNSISSPQQQSTPLPEQQQQQHHSSHSSERSYDDNINIQQQQQQQQSPSIKSSQSSNKTIKSQKTSLSQQKRPLLLSHHHRRVTSVDQTLYDLTHAMAAVDNRVQQQQQEEDDDDDEEENNDNNDDDDENVAAAATAVDGFTRNVMLLASVANNNKSKRNLWDVVRNNLPIVKEQNNNNNTSTDEDEDDNDEEQESDVDEVFVDESNNNNNQNVNNNNEDIESGVGVGGGDGNSSNNNNNNNGTASNTIKKKKKKKRLNKKLKKLHQSTKEIIKDDYDAFAEFFKPRRRRITRFIKLLIFYVVIPLVGISCLLYYGFNNPPSTGQQQQQQQSEQQQEETTVQRASVSYILLFCCRQIVTFSLSLAMQGMIIDFLGLGTKVLLNIFGPIITLLIVQSKGWPHILFWWSILDFAMLAGNRSFSHHWLYYQHTLDVFNENNNSGNIVHNGWYIRILSVTVCVSVVVSIKRFLLGLYLGRQTYSYYGQQLANVMSKMLLVSEVASLAKIIENNNIDKSRNDATRNLYAFKSVWKPEDNNNDNDGNETYRSIRSIGNNSGTNQSSSKGGGVFDPNNRDPLTGSLHYSEKIKLMQLLDQWEEPTRYDNPTSNEIASISAVLRFRKALTFIQKRYPFSQAFGLADCREACVESSQSVYNRLLKANNNDDEMILNFETIATLALDTDGNLDRDKTKSLIKVFRPDREGNLSVLDFVKSVDTVYKEFRLLEATIMNSSQIDRAFENIFNVVFYIIVFTIVLSQLGFDPFALFLSLSSIILAFAFMIGNASAKYFEGVLFILVRRPYGIGDRISVGPVEDTKPSLDGAMPWVVQNVTLFETVVTLLPTNETASLSNGSLANSRIINWARSPQARLHIFLNFPLDTPYEKLVVFKTAIEEYMKARPREWRALNGFRVNRVYANQNYMEFRILIQHREAWQQIGIVLDSKANLTSYCQECARQLGLQYQAPVLPVAIREPNTAATAPTLDEDALTREFQSLARTKHQIRVC